MVWAGAPKLGLKGFRAELRARAGAAGAAPNDGVVGGSGACHVQRPHPLVAHQRLYQHSQT